MEKSNSTLGKLLNIIVGGVYILVGIWGLFVDPEEGLNFLKWFLGLSALFVGLTILFLSFEVKRHEETANLFGVTLLRGILLLIVSMVFLIYPKLTLELILVYTGIMLVFEGIMFIAVRRSGSDLGIGICLIIFGLFLTFSLGFQLFTALTIYVFAMISFILFGIQKVISVFVKNKEL